MSRVEVDLSNYKDKVGQRVPEGRYRVIVEDTELDKSNAGNQMINLWLRVTTEGKFKGSIIVDRLVLTEKSLFRVVGFMQAIGLPTPRKRLSLDPERQFKGKVLDVDVEDGEPYLGRIKSEVKGYLLIEGGQPVSHDLDDLTEVSAQTIGSGAPADQPRALPPEDLPEVPGHPGGLAEFAPGGAADQAVAAANPVSTNGSGRPAPEPAQVPAGNVGSMGTSVTVSPPEEINLDELDL